MNPIRALSEYTKAVEEGQNAWLKINKEGKLEVEKHGRTWQVFHKIRAFFSSDHDYDLKKIAKKLDELSSESIKTLPPEEKLHFKKGLGLLNRKIISYDKARGSVLDKNSASRVFVEVIFKDSAAIRFIGNYKASSQEKAIISKIPDHLWEEFLMLREKAPDLDSPEARSLIGRFRDSLDERSAKQLGQIMQKINNKDSAAVRFIGNYKASSQEKAIISKIPDHLWEEFLMLREKASDLDSPEVRSLINRFQSYLNKKNERELLRYTLLNINAHEAIEMEKNRIEQDQDLPD